MRWQPPVLVAVSLGAIAPVSQRFERSRGVSSADVRRGSAGALAQRVQAHHLRRARGVAIAPGAPRGDTRFSASPHAPHGHRPAARAALVLRALWPGLHRAGAPRPAGLPARPRGQPPRAGLQRGQLPLARGRLRRAGARCSATGCSTIDGDYHRRARRIMLPAFHRDRDRRGRRRRCSRRPSERSSLAAGRGRGRLRTGRASSPCGSRCGRCSGLDPDDRGTGALAAREFERALSFYGTEYALRVLRGPAVAVAADAAARARCSTASSTREIERRRARRRRARATSSAMLMAATDEDGSRLSDRRGARPGRDAAVRRATTRRPRRSRSCSTSSPATRRAGRAAGRAGRRARRRAGHGRRPRRRAAAAGHGARRDAAPLPARLDRPAAGGRAFEFAGTRVPGGVYVNYCSWASHRLPDVFPDPEAFVPERFAPERKAALPKGAYVPFGGGSRTCIGMRFGQMEVKAIVDARCCSASGSSCCPGATHDRPPDAHAEPARWPLDGRSRARRAGARAGPRSSAVTLV